MEADVQAAVVSRLLAAPAVAALVGAGVYDFPGADAVEPYITIGNDQTVDDSDGCGTRYEVTSQIHAWSKKVGRVEAKQICAAIRDALADHKLTVSGWRCKVADYRATRILNDPNGVTTHGIVELRYVFERVA